MTNFLSGKKKILTMILGIVVGLLITFGLDLGEVNVIAGAVVSLASTVSYLFIEGKIDVERIKRAAEDINEIIEYIGEDEPENEDTEDMPNLPEEYAGDVAEAVNEWRDTV